MHTAHRQNDLESTAPPGVRKYGLPQLALAGLRLLVTLPRLLRARSRGALDPAFREKLSLITTAVNGCPYCAWFHARQAEQLDVPTQEIAALLAGVIERPVHDTEALGLLFAQHYAETNAKPDPVSIASLRQAYGVATAGDILITLQWMTFANLAGNSYHAFVERVRDRRFGGRDFLHELAVFLVTAPIFAPVDLFMRFGSRAPLSHSPTRDIRVLENRIPPPMVAALFACLSLGLSEAGPRIGLAFQHRLFIAASLTFVAFVFLGGAIMAFIRVRTTLSPLQPDQATSLVSYGVYRLSRNPMYLGLALSLAAFAVYLGALTSLLAVVGFVLYMNRYQIAAEERALQAKFGTAFSIYRRRIRRWL